MLYNFEVRLGNLLLTFRFTVTRLSYSVFPVLFNADRYYFQIYSAVHTANINKQLCQEKGRTIPSPFTWYWNRDVLHNEFSCKDHLLIEKFKNNKRTRQYENCEYTSKCSAFRTVSLILRFKYNVIVVPVKNKQISVFDLSLISD